MGFGGPYGTADQIVRGCQGGRTSASSNCERPAASRGPRDGCVVTKRDRKALRLLVASGGAAENPPLPRPPLRRGQPARGPLRLPARPGSSRSRPARRHSLVRRPLAGLGDRLPAAETLRRAPDDEAGRAHRALSPKLLAARRSRARPLRRLRLDPHRLRADRASRLPVRYRPPLRRRNLPSLPGAHGNRAETRGWRGNRLHGCAMTTTTSECHEDTPAARTRRHCARNRSRLGGWRREYLRPEAPTRAKSPVMDQRWTRKYG